jgi:hypothetical protein
MADTEMNTDKDRYTDTDKNTDEDNLKRHYRNNKRVLYKSIF